MPTLIIDRRRLVAALVVGLLAVGLAVLAGGDATRERALRGLASRSLDEVASLAGARGDAGEMLAGERIGVVVVQDAGAPWIREAVQDAVAGSRYFVERDDTQDALRAETLEASGAIALQLHLLRRGWAVRAPQPQRIRVQPWIPMLGAVIGGLVGLLLRRASVGLIVAGATAQLLLGVIAPGTLPLPPQSWVQEVGDGPLIAPLVEFAGAWGAMGNAIAGAVVVFCMVLVAFDHRRSRGTSGSIGLGGAGVLAFMGAAGAAMWIEAALRSSLVYSLTTWQGALAGVALLAAWVPALLAARERWRG